jgi:LuxR family maltose regulon positive regulatory protein
MRSTMGWLMVCPPRGRLDLDHLPGGLHVLLASRADPPLPLARLRARDQLAELGAADLRFTPEEAAAFLRDGVGLDRSRYDHSAAW